MMLFIVVYCVLCDVFVVCLLLFLFLLLLVVSFIVGRWLPVVVCVLFVCCCFAFCC